MDKREASRELDAWIAEHVMGWSDFWEGEGYVMGYPPNEQAMGIDGERAPVPPYSTDIAAAWQVVERMTARMGYDDPHFDWVGPLFKPEHRYLTEEGYPLGTTCWFVRVEDRGFIHHVCADTPELAICLAAREVYKGEHS
jgi:hypothetical protein